MQPIHILNGDSLKSRWPKAIEGELIVARECLIDGNVKGDSLAELFANRAKFICSYGGFTEEDYYRKTVTEFEKLMQIQPGRKIYCWFEHDLFCQVNFWFVLSLLTSHTNDNEIYFVGPNKGNEYSFAHMSQDDLAVAQNSALLISDNELKLLSKLWPLYQYSNLNNNCEEMFAVAQQLTKSFPFLTAAINAQQDRSPDESGYGRPERRLLAIMAELGSKDFTEVFRQFSQTEAIYSFGDMQVKSMFDRLLLR